jgi:hypothetical protein
MASADTRAIRMVVMASVLCWSRSVKTVSTLLS